MKNFHNILLLIRCKAYAQSGYAKCFILKLDIVFIVTVLCNSDQARQPRHVTHISSMVYSYLILRNSTHDLKSFNVHC